MLTLDPCFDPEKSRSTQYTRVQPLGVLGPWRLWVTAARLCILAYVSRALADAPLKVCGTSGWTAHQTLMSQETHTKTNKGTPRKNLRSNSDLRSFNTRELFWRLCRNSAQRTNVDMLVGQNSSFKSLRSQFLQIMLIRTGQQNHDSLTFSVRSLIGYLAGTRPGR